MPNVARGHNQRDVRGVHLLRPKARFHLLHDKTERDFPYARCFHVPRWQFRQHQRGCPQYRFL
jgi:hypothetical protein